MLPYGVRTFLWRTLQLTSDHLPSAINLPHSPKKKTNHGERGIEMDYKVPTFWNIRVIRVISGSISSAYWFHTSFQFFGALDVNRAAPTLATSGNEVLYVIAFVTADHHDEVCFRDQLAPKPIVDLSSACKPYRQIALHFADAGFGSRARSRRRARSAGWSAK
jgi:hypothetical protein